MIAVGIFLTGVLIGAVGGFVVGLACAFRAADQERFGRTIEKRYDR